MSSHRQTLFDLKDEIELKAKEMGGTTHWTIVENGDDFTLKLEVNLHRRNIAREAPKCRACGDFTDSLLLVDDNGNEWWGCSKCEKINKKTIVVTIAPEVPK